MAKLSASKARIILFVLTVAMFVIGSGAPSAGGGVIEKIHILGIGF